MPLNKTKMGRAERMFRDAFQRLKENKPENLPKGTPVTQNNVAMEAGVIKSALRGSRYPALSEEIKQWIKDNPGIPNTEHQRLLKRRKTTRTLREKIETISAQRNRLQARLADADRVIIELTRKVKVLESQMPAAKPNVSPLNWEEKT